MKVLEEGQSNYAFQYFSRIPQIEECLDLLDLGWLEVVVLLRCCLIDMSLEKLLKIPIGFVRKS